MMRRRYAGALLLGAACVLAGCHGSLRPIAHDGPIVLITLDAFRADIVGALGGGAGLTPSLDALASEANWAGRSVSASSWTVPSMAAIFTGLQPWRHGNGVGGRTVLREDLVVLPEALQALGYRGSAFRSNHWLEKSFGYAQGFEQFFRFGQGKRAKQTLRSLDGSQQFVWIHLLPPHAPYVRRDFLLPRLEASSRKALPARLSPLDLEPYFDPARALPEELHRQAWALYRLNAAWSDHLLGGLLQALEESGQWDRTLLVVTSDHGEEFGEMRQVLHGGNLGRQLIEVPLMIKLPRSFPRPLAIEPGQAVGSARVFATLVDAAGGEASELAAPSLFQRASLPVLSELYSGNGVNQFSLVTADRQLLWTTRFAPAEPAYFSARLADLGGHPQPPLSEPTKAIFGRLERAFLQALPLAGPAGARPELQAWQWLPSGQPSATRRIDDATITADLARRLRAAWKAANGAETPPSQLLAGGQPQLSDEDRAELRALGYVVGGN